jgi:predicted transcriptional regulator
MAKVKDGRVQITTYVATNVADTLEELAQKQQRSLASLLRLAVFQYLEREGITTKGRS